MINKLQWTTPMGWFVGVLLFCSTVKSFIWYETRPAPPPPKRETVTDFVKNLKTGQSTWIRTDEILFDRDKNCGIFNGAVGQNKPDAEHPVKIVDNADGLDVLIYTDYKWKPTDSMISNLTDTLAANSARTEKTLFAEPKTEPDDTVPLDNIQSTVDQATVDSTFYVGVDSIAIDPTHKAYMDPNALVANKPTPKNPIKVEKTEDGLKVTVPPTIRWKICVDGLEDWTPIHQFKQMK